MAQKWDQKKIQATGQRVKLLPFSELQASKIDGDSDFASPSMPNGSTNLNRGNESDGDDAGSGY